jgi:hypothetical protein
LQKLFSPKSDQGSHPHDIVQLGLLDEDEVVVGLDLLLQRLLLGTQLFASDGTLLSFQFLRVPDPVRQLHLGPIFRISFGRNLQGKILNRGQL